MRLGGGGSFAPTLPLTLTQVSLTGPTTNLTVTDATTVLHHVQAARSIGIAGRRISVLNARRASAGLLLLSLLAAALLAWLAGRSAPDGEAAGIRRRYPSLLVAVAPMPTPAGRPVIEVVDFATLARLAERYGLLVLHWTRSGVDTFVVQDDATTYRYRAGSPPAAAAHTGAPGSGDLAEAAVAAEGLGGPDSLGH